MTFGEALITKKKVGERGDWNLWPIGSSLDISRIISARVIDPMECFEVGGKEGEVALFHKFYGKPRAREAEWLAWDHMSDLWRLEGSWVWCLFHT